MAMSDGLYLLPSGWEWRKLGDLCHLITKGSTPTTYGFKFVNSGINFIKIENIAKGKIQKQTIQSFITKEANQAQKRSILQENDILFSIAGTIGESCIVTKDDLPANTNQALAIIRLLETVDANFIRLLLSSEVLDVIRNKQRGGALKNISLEDVKNADIPLPPLDEQKRIMEKLDGLFAKIDKAIALLDESIASASAILPSALNEVFGELSEKYNYLSVNELSVQIQSGFAVNKKHETSNGYVHLRTHNISTSGKLNFDYLVKIEQSMIKTSCNKISKGDILFNNTNSTELVGKTALADKDYNFAFSNHLTKISLKRSLANPEYFVFAFMFLFNNGYFMSICNKWIG